MGQVFYLPPRLHRLGLQGRLVTIYVGMARCRSAQASGFGSWGEKSTKFIGTNGAESEGWNNPQRQGLSADLAGGHRPDNVLGGIPTVALDYSPRLGCSVV